MTRDLFFQFRFLVNITAYAPVHTAQLRCFDELVHVSQGNVSLFMGSRGLKDRASDSYPEVVGSEGGAKKLIKLRDNNERLNNCYQPSRIQMRPTMLNIIKK